MTAAATIVASLLVAVPAGAQATGPSTSGPIYLDSSYSFEERAADLVARLTPAQRASQIVSSQAPAISSLVNPLLSPTQTAARTTLAVPASGGDTTIKVASVSGMAVGTPLVVDSLGTQEPVTVTAVGSAAANATTLTVPSLAGDTNFKVASVTGMTVDHQVRFDTGANLELGTIAAVGTQSRSTTLALPSIVGDTNVKVGSVTGMLVGDEVRIDSDANLEIGTIQTVGTQSRSTTLAMPATAGDTNVKLASVTGMAAGDQLRIDTGANLEITTIGTVGTAAGTVRTLSAPAVAGDTNIKVSSVNGMVVGHLIRIDTGANLEIGTIQTVGTSGAGGTGITLTAPLTLAHALGAQAQDLGTGVTVTAPLTLAHEFGVAVQDPGTGLTLAAPLTLPHDAGAAVLDPGTGITLAAPLTLPHVTGSPVQDTGTGVTITPALAGAHDFGAFVSVMTGIPAYGWWNEALHGINAESLNASGNAVTLTNTTSYPIDLSRGASWDPALTYEVAAAESDEAREIMRLNKLDLDFFSPTVNIGRDPRWGRNDESYGEDPLLQALVAAQFVNGMEGKDQNGKLLPEGNGFYKATTTLKHYALNNTEGTSSGDPNGRLNASSDTDDRTIREFYTMTFRKIVQASQNAAIMSSYNRINGVPSAANTYLNDTLMRQTFGLEGYFVGDCDAVNQVNSRHHWQPATLGHIATPFEQFAFTLGSGVDIECNAGYNGSGNYRGATSASTTTGGTMNAVGMQITTPTGLHTVNDLDVSATRAFTNRMKLGEFDPDSTVPWLTEAVARNQSYGVFPWVNTTAPTQTADRLDLARRSAEASLVLLKNATITRKDSTVGKLLPIAVPPSGAFKVLVVGAFANNTNFYLGGYSAIQSAAGQANMVTPYAGLKSAIEAINPAAQVDTLTGFTSTGTQATSCCTEIDSAAVSAAADYDYVIVYTGMDGSIAREDRDRTEITLPGLQGELIAEVAAVNPNTIGVMEADPIDVTEFEPGTPAILWSSYNGQRKGEALADVLLGTYNPSGRLPQTFYQSVDQLPPTSSYDIRPVGPTGRTYMYFNGPVSYPFGHGLSYSTFGYSNLVIDNHAPTADGTINVSVDVTNSGSMDGNEIVQMYVNTPNADPALERPIKRLMGFQKVFLAAGQTKTVTLPIEIAELAFFDEAAGRWVVDNGAYGVQISTSSADADIQVRDTISVTGVLTPKPSVLTAKPRIDGADLARGISQRVMFPEGVEIDPGLTLAMNDDSLYGFILPGQSKAFPKGTKFSYSSNRPTVVSVKGGKIRTVANGAATVTATATYNGQSASTKFVVRVLSDLGDLKVNGDTIGGFHPDVFDYDVILPPGATELPQVSAGAPTGTVAVSQAVSVPGRATITSTGPDGIVATYTVNFALAAQSDDFDGDSLGAQWSFVRETPADWSLTANPGSLTITPKTGDLLTTTNTARNVLLQPALGDWTMSSKVTFSARPNAATQQGGIIAYQDDDNYLKFDLEATSGSNIQFNTSLEDSLNSNPNVATANNPTGTVQVAQTLNTTNANAILPADNTIWLRMSKTGSTYATSYSLDGETWVPVWSTGATLKDVKVGVFAFNRAGTTTSLQVAFDDFALTVGADQQIASLHDYVGILDLDKGLTKDLQNKLEDAQKKLGQGKDEDACKKLDEFVTKVVDQAGKTDPKLTVAQAQVLLYANDILINLGCLDPASPVPAAENDLLLLGQTIDGMGLEKPVADDLGNRVREANKHLAQGKLGETCSDLGGLTAKISEFESTGKLTATQAAELSTEVTAIGSSLGC